MTADEIFHSFPDARACLGDLREQSRESYRAAATLLASRRKLRLVFLDKKPLAERHAWLANELGRKSNADVATEVLQGWLIGCRKPMLQSFLDALKVPHKEGLIEELPSEPPLAELQAAVDGLLATHPAWEVAAYLNLFCEMDIARWPQLREIVSSDARLAPSHL